MKLVLLGVPGSGKGTQADMLSAKYNIPMISTGAIFRENVQNQTELGVRVKQFLNAGLYVPDTITNELIKIRLEKDDCKDGFILDGYPRTLSQADYLSSISKIDCVINIELSDAEIITRMSGRRTCSCGATYHLKFKPSKEEGICDNCKKELYERDDQKEEVIKKRIQVYHEQTKPLIDYYREKHMLKEIYGEQPIESVFNDIIEVLQKLS